MKPRSYTRAQARRDLPHRSIRDNKTRGGKCLIFAGSAGMWGAGILCAQAAARSGAGYVYLYDGKGLFPTTRHPDFLILSQKKELQWDDFKAVAIGPGYRQPQELRRWLKALARKKISSVVIDAECIAAFKSLKIKAQPSWILTPHEGELARFLDIQSSEVKRDRQAAVLRAQKQFGGIVLLKGHRTLVADGKKVYAIAAGNPALAKAGTGDVLTGIITALLAQQLEPQVAACLAAYIHGFIADEWRKNKNDVLSLIASDLIRSLPSSLQKIRSRP